MKINWTKQSLLLLTASLVILAGGLYFGKKMIVDPAQHAHASTSRILADQETLMKQVEDRALSEQMLTEELESINAAIPISKEPSGWLNELKQIADVENIEIGIMNSTESSGEGGTEAEPENEVGTLSYQLEVEYEALDNLTRFIETVYDLKQVTDISSIYYEPGQTMQYRATLFLETYYQETVPADPSETAE